MKIDLSKLSNQKRGVATIDFLDDIPDAPVETPGKFTSFLQKSRARIDAAKAVETDPFLKASHGFTENVFGAAENLTGAVNRFIGAGKTGFKAATDSSQTEEELHTRALDVMTEPTLAILQGMMSPMELLPDPVKEAFHPAIKFMGDAGAKAAGFLTERTGLSRDMPILASAIKDKSREIAPFVGFEAGARIVPPIKTSVFGKKGVPAQKIPGKFEFTEPIAPKQGLISKAQGKIQKTLDNQIDATLKADIAPKGKRGAAFLAKEPHFYKNYLREEIKGTDIYEKSESIRQKQEGYRRDLDRSLEENAAYKDIAIDDIFISEIEAKMRSELIKEVKTGSRSSAEASITEVIQNLKSDWKEQLKGGKEGRPLDIQRVKEEWSNVYDKDASTTANEAGKFVYNELMRRIEDITSGEARELNRKLQTLKVAKDALWDNQGRALKNVSTGFFTKLALLTSSGILAGGGAAAGAGVAGIGGLGALPVAVFSLYRLALKDPVFRDIATKNYLRASDTFGKMSNKTNFEQIAELQKIAESNPEVAGIMAAIQSQNPGLTLLELQRKVKESLGMFKSKGFEKRLARGEKVARTQEENQRLRDTERRIVTDKTRFEAQEARSKRLEKEDIEFANRKATEESERLFQEETQQNLEQETFKSDELARAEEAKKTLDKLLGKKPIEKETVRVEETVEPVEQFSREVTDFIELVREQMRTKELDPLDAQKIAESSPSEVLNRELIDYSENIKNEGAKDFLRDKSESQTIVDNWTKNLKKRKAEDIDQLNPETRLKLEEDAQRAGMTDSELFDIAREVGDKEKLAAPKTVEAKVPKKKAPEASLETKPKDLRQEAKSFDTAEEFVEAQGETLYHGTNADFQTFDINKIGTQTDHGLFGQGFYFARNEGMAKQALFRGDAKNVMEVKLSIKNPLKLKEFESVEALADYLDMSESALIKTGGGEIKPVNSQAAQFSSRVQAKGHDAIDIDRGKMGSEIVVFDPKNIKTKQQLTDIWNKANKTPEIKTPEPSQSDTLPIEFKESTSVDLLPKDITLEAESKLVGSKRISPDRIKHHQLLPEKSLASIKENLTDILTKAKVNIEAGRNYVVSKRVLSQFEDIKQRIEKGTAGERESKWYNQAKDRVEIAKNLKALEVAAGKEKGVPQKNLRILEENLQNPEFIKDTYIDLVKKDISRGYKFSDEVLGFDKAFQIAVNNRERYEKGLRTSFSADDARIVFDEKGDVTVGIKRQDGKPLELKQKEEIINGALDVEKHLGIDMKKMAENERWVYVHLNNKNPFLMKGVSGLYRKDPFNKSVSISVGGVEFFEVMKEGKKVKKSVNTTMAHELGHVLDSRVDWGLIDPHFTNQRAFDFNPMEMSPREAKYYKNKKEVTARMIEQYIAVEKGHTAIYDRGAYWKKEIFDKEIKPTLDKAIKKDFKDYLLEK